MNQIRLSYVLTTFNKLRYLKNTLPILLKKIKEDEEIVITDGGSTDGTQEYLSDLFDRGKINQFISKRDCGEAHGFNRAILMAKGIIIKPISDDDLFDFDIIRTCGDYLINNDEIDLLGTGGISYNYNLQIDQLNSSITSDLALMQAYRTSKRPFYISGLGLLFRKDSISKMGLYGVNYKRVDMEFWLRCSANPSVKIEYRPVNSYCWIANINSNSFGASAKKRMEMESYNLPNYFINSYNDLFYSNPVLDFLKHNWRWFLRFKNYFLAREVRGNQNYILNASDEELTLAYSSAIKALATANDNIV